LGEFNGMSSHSHVSHCRVLPIGEFTVMIPEPHATVQGVRIPSTIFKIVFAIFFFVFNAVYALTSGGFRIVSDTLVMPPPRGYNAVIGVRRPSVRPSVCPSVRPSDAAYIGSNSKTKRPRKTKLCTGVAQVTCDSNTDFKVKSQLRSRGGGILWRVPTELPPGERLQI